MAQTSDLTIEWLGKFIGRQLADRAPNAEAITVAKQLIATMQSEADLKHDIERHLAICSELAAENERLRDFLEHIDGVCTDVPWDQLLHARND